MYKVILESVGNIDKGQHPDISLPDVPIEEKFVLTLEEASKECRKYIEEYDLGGGNWAGGSVFDTETKSKVAKISYNGRIWLPGSDYFKG